MGPYQLNKDGQVVHVFRSTTYAPDGTPQHLTRGTVGHAGQVFDDLPEHVKRPIEDGETGDLWTILGTPDSEMEVEEPDPPTQEPPSLVGVKLDQLRSDQLQGLVAAYQIDVTGTGSGGDVLRRDMITALSAEQERQEG